MIDERQEEIHRGQVRVSLEGFGGQSLIAVLERPDVEGKTFEEVLQIMTTRPYAGKDKETYMAIERQKKSSGGFRSMVGIGSPNRFEPISLKADITPYIQRAPGLTNVETLRTAVLGSHILGYQN